jgi:hypothetical protein
MFMLYLFIRGLLIHCLSSRNPKQQREIPRGRHFVMTDKQFDWDGAVAYSHKLLLDADFSILFFL